MSSNQPPVDPTAGPGGQGEQPSPEEVRAYLEQVRGAPVDQVVAEVASALLNAAQVKLGRRDARLLLDLVGDVTERVRGVLPDELTKQLSDVLAQLRLAQVEAEREVAAASAQGHAEPGDLDDAGGDQSTVSEAASEGTPAGEASRETPPANEGGASSSAASRLWVPGQ